MKKINLLFTAVFMILLVSCAKSDKDFRSELIDIESLEQFETSIQSGVSLIFFHATWCSLCNSQRPAIEELLDDSELSKVFIGEVNYEKVSAIVNQYNIQGFPTIVFYKDGSEASRMTGSRNSSASIKNRLLSLL